MVEQQTSPEEMARKHYNQLQEMGYIIFFEEIDGEDGCDLATWWQMDEAERVCFVMETWREMSEDQFCFAAEAKDPVRMMRVYKDKDGENQVRFYREIVIGFSDDRLREAGNAFFDEKWRHR